MQGSKILYKNILKIYNLTVLMKGYCQNADGSAIFVSCLEDVLGDVEDLSLECLESV